MTFFVTSFASFFSRCFHKRNVIIVSQRKVKHIHLSVPLQFTTIMATLVAVCWASYSTGSFFAARSALKQQGQVLRSVTNAHIDSNFNSIYSPPNSETLAANRSPYQHLENPMVSTGFTSPLASLDNAQLIARITLLENKVVELKTTNEAIVQEVHDKTSGRMGDLLNAIKHTGLNVSQLKKEYKQTASKTDQLIQNPAQTIGGEGGPYVPIDTMDAPLQTQEVLASLDDLALLNTIINNIPLAMPMENAQEQSTFGRRTDPFNGHLAFHSGLDLSGPIGSKIYSTAEGKVIAAGRNGGYGNAIDIDHGHGIVTRYGHLSVILVEPGKMVEKGEQIGVQGSTGRSTGPHLHYEVRYHDVAMNPKNFLNVGQYVLQE